MVGRLVKRFGASRLDEFEETKDFEDLIEAAELERSELDNISVPDVALTCSRKASN